MLGTLTKGRLTIDELDPRAREQAFSNLREVLWDPNWFEDVLFKPILEEEGFPKEKLAWGLGYVQGDGVSWYGDIDLEKFLRKNRIWTRYKEFAPSSVSISGETARFSGPGSMEVELQLSGGWEDLVPPSLRTQMEDWDREENSRWSEINRARQEWAQGIPRGVKEWRPQRGPEPIYEPRETPSWYQASLDRAQTQWSELEARAQDLKNVIQERVDELARKLQELGYEEIEYQQSEKFLHEMIEANEYMFDEEGNLARKT